jgi:hypothetical protein
VYSVAHLLLRDLLLKCHAALCEPANLLPLHPKAPGRGSRLKHRLQKTQLRQRLGLLLVSHNTVVATTPIDL